MPTSFDTRLGREIAVCRTRLGISQERLGFQCKVHRTYVSQIERGLKSPTVRTLRRIAEALGTTTSRLLAAVEDRRS